MAVRNDFSAGETLTAQDLNDTFASKVDYALPTNAQTGTAYTFVAADAEKLTTASNGSAVTLTIPPASSVAWPDNTVLRVVNYGAGAVTIDGGSGVTVTNTASTIAQYGAAVAIRTGSDAWTVVPFGGGDVPAAEVSSPAATGQYTDTGITYDYYTFTASGTLTVDTAGFADVLVVGGGGGAPDLSDPSNTTNGGGGAGGHIFLQDVYLSATTHTVTVGAGGSKTDGNASLVGPFLAAGGGEGGLTRAGDYSTPGGGSSSGGGGSVPSRPGGAGLSGYGNNGGTGGSGSNGGGGGAGGAGSNAAGGNIGGAGGAGTANSITGSSVTRAGGGGGGGASGGGAGGSGGGGAGGGSGGTGGSGTANTGGGGGGVWTGTPGNGGSGIVIVRVKV